MQHAIANTRGLLAICRLFRVAGNVVAHPHIGHVAYAATDVGCLPHAAAVRRVAVQPSRWYSGSEWQQEIPDLIWVVALAAATFPVGRYAARR